MSADLAEGRRLVPLAEDVDQAEVGRFRLTCSGRHVHLDVAVDAKKHRELLRVWPKTEARDCG